MRTKTLAVGVLLSWVGCALLVGSLIADDSPTHASEGRSTIVLEGEEREVILREMRTLLTAVQGIVAGLGDSDMAWVTTAARAGGVAATHAMPPPLMAKLPPDFKQAGLKVHRGFDEMAAAAQQQEPPALLLTRLADQLANCVACHEAYRIDVAPGGPSQ